MISEKHLRRGLAEAEANVAAYRRVLALLNGDGRATKIKTMGAVLDQAIAVDGARRAAAGKKKGRPVKDRRQETARVLAWMDGRGPLAGPAIVEATKVRPQWFGPVTRRGYLKQLPDGRYRRTNKVFTAEKAR